ncbi:MAG TPA: hypothetical protein VLG44_07310 [Chlamydiales bacterium]|nr:hypothetical protein [Chlamydiales bacterium]
MSLLTNVRDTLSSIDQTVTGGCFTRAGRAAYFSVLSARRNPIAAIGFGAIAATSIAAGLFYLLKDYRYEKIILSNQMHLGREVCIAELYGCNAFWCNFEFYIPGKTYCVPLERRDVAPLADIPLGNPA